MANTHLEPMGDYLLVVDNLVETSLDGIILPDNQRQQEMCFGTVVAVGPACSQIQKENIILFGPYAGKHVIIEGIQFRLLREGQAEGRVVQHD